MPEPPYSQKSSGKCPHCREIVCFDEPDKISVNVPGSQEYVEFPAYLRVGSGDTEVFVYSSRCPNCKKPIVAAQTKEGENQSDRLVYPPNMVRPVSGDVPKEIREDFLEAAAVLSTSEKASAVLSTSEKASAALSRRCLQNLLTDVGYKQKDLNDQINKQ